MKVLILGGSPNHLGGVETFGDRAEAALQAHAPGVVVQRYWTQTAYLNWLDGSRTALRLLDPGVRVVLVMRGSQAQRLMSRSAGFALAGGDRQALLYERRPVGVGGLG